jgi:beta-glucosidase
MTQNFPAGFVWGAATSSYQIEGAAEEDGKALSIWDVFSRRPGAVWMNHTGDTACDHYHLYPQDVDLMKRLGLKAYRFSTAWARIFPDGTGQVNSAGLDFYERLTDRLLEAGIAPYATLFHWDLPYALHTRGGWLNPYSPDWFADYAGAVVKRLGDRVQHWMTFNEMQVIVRLGYGNGTHAPGERRPFQEQLRIAHHLLLAHGKGVQAIRSAAPRPVQVGVAQVGQVFLPETDAPRDIAAARAATFGIALQHPWTAAWKNDPGLLQPSPEGGLNAYEADLGRNLWGQSWFADPIFLKQYPQDGLKWFEPYLPPIAAGDMDLIAQPIDFYGMNTYRAETVRAGAEGAVEFCACPDGYPISAFYWWVMPEALYWGPRFAWERYHTPIYITENGMANTDWPALDGHVHDPQRIDYTARYLDALQRAATDGTDVRGYFHWSLLDNFEWGEGYRQRFGLVYVDFQTQRRIPKDSFEFYRRVIAANALVAPAD